MMSAQSDAVGQALPSAKLGERPTFSEIAGLHLRRIAQRLSTETNVHTTLNDTVLTIVPKGDDGFPITIFVSARHCSADFGGCRQDFDDLGQVGACIDKVLTGTCRLRIDSRGSQPFRWTLEENSAHREPAVLMSSGYASLNFWPFRNPTTSRTFAYLASR